MPTFPLINALAVLKEPGVATIHFAAPTDQEVGGPGDIWENGRLYLAANAVAVTLGENGSLSASDLLSWDGEGALASDDGADFATWLGASLWSPEEVEPVRITLRIESITDLLFLNANLAKISGETFNNIKGFRVHYPVSFAADPSDQGLLFLDEKTNDLYNLIKDHFSTIGATVCNDEDHTDNDGYYLTFDFPDSDRDIETVYYEVNSQDVFGLGGEFKIPSGSLVCCIGADFGGVPLFEVIDCHSNEAFEGRIYRMTLDNIKTLSVYK